ncbi:uncharacterized protein [Elaeis guineensis]|uniref:uncharacterized protein n=1 Tax=Elaeis guineensis var. tenera TaxID=51953 RepID=UPI003C6D473D
MYGLTLERSLEAVWIWRVTVHPRIRLFLWKVAWDRLPTLSLLIKRGIELPAACLVCGLEDETTEHALIYCPRACLIWRMAGYPPWGVSYGSWPSPFPDAICQSSSEGSKWGDKLAYIAYQIWLSNNSLIFEDGVVPAC